MSRGTRSKLRQRITDRPIFLQHSYLFYFSECDYEEEMFIIMANYLQDLLFPPRLHQTW
jgi:hypothetical protein